MRTKLVNPILCLPGWIGPRYQPNVALWESVVAFDPAPVYSTLEGLIDPSRRIQAGLSMQAMWPNPQPGICACGCGEPAKQRWHRPDHSKFAYEVFEIIYGRTRTIERYISMLAGDQCRHCGVSREATYQVDRGILYLDHIIPVKHGGGAAWLSNYQLLCGPCHRLKTNSDFGWKSSKKSSVFLPLFEPQK